MELQQQKTFDGGLILSGYSHYNYDDPYLIKVDSTGDSVWSKIYQFSADQRVSDIIETRDSSYLFVGYVDSDSIQDGQDAYLMKVSSKGDSLWMKRYSTNENEYFISIIELREGGFIVAGSSQNYDPPNYGKKWLLRLDQNGDTLWTKKYSRYTNLSHGGDAAHKVIQTHDGGFLVRGTRNIVKFDANGDSLWVGDMNGNMNDDGHPIIQVKDSSFYYVSGNLNLIHMSKDGEHLWEKELMTAKKSLHAKSIEQTTDGGFLICGSRKYYNSSPSEYIIIKTDSAGMACGTYSFDSITVCEPYQSPSGKYIWEAPGAFHDTIENYAGCDSFMTITLLEGSIPLDTIDTIVCDSFLAPSGNYYSSSGVHMDTLEKYNDFGCHEVYRINLNVRSSYYQVLELFTCDSVISPSGKVYSEEGVYFDTLATINGCDSIFEIDVEVREMDLKLHEYLSSDPPYVISHATESTFQWLDCNNSNVEFPSQNWAWYDLIEYGSYALEVNNGACVDTTECYDYYATIIESNSNSFFQNKSFFEFHETLIVRVYNVVGKELVAVKVNNGQSIEFSEILDHGFYIVSISNLDNQLRTESRKIMVRK